MFTKCDKVRTSTRKCRPCDDRRCRGSSNKFPSLTQFPSLSGNSHQRNESGKKLCSTLYQLPRKGFAPASNTLVVIRKDVPGKIIRQVIGRLDESLQSPYGCVDGVKEHVGFFGHN